LGAVKADDAANAPGKRSRLTASRRLVPREKSAETIPAAEREPGRLTQSLAVSLADFGVPTPAKGDFSHLVAAIGESLRRLGDAKQAVETEFSQAATDRAALKALVATQREELQSLRQQNENISEALRQQRLLGGQQLSELAQRYNDLMTTYREFRIQADTIYAAFEYLRSTGLTGIWQVFGAALRDRELYDAVVLILTSGLFDEAFFCRQCAAGEIPAGLSPIVYFLRHTGGLERDPHRLFSVGYYRTQLPAARIGGNALMDYLQYGHDLSPHPLFMPSYYLEQLPGLANITGIAPLMHYCIAGLASGANPHPLFDNAYYVKQLESEGVHPPANLLSFYLRRRSADTSPHPLFDAAFYRSRYLDGNTDADPLVHYLTTGDQQGYNPHAYFHTRFYRHANPDSARSGVAALAHFILEGAEENRAPHPMFDLAYYKRANPAVTETGYRLLVHFVAEGEAKAANPHPLIDLAYVKRQLADRDLDDSRPFRALLDPANVEFLSPHPLFDVAFYRGQSPGAAAYAGGPFLYYLLAGHRRGEPMHPLFDPAFYRAQAEARGIAVTDPLVEFLTPDAAAIETLVNPHPLFDIDYYAKVGTAIEGNPLLHYLSRGDRRGRNPHPLFDVAYYRRRAGIEDEQPALVHYIINDGRAGDPHPLFDTAYYLAGLPEASPPSTAPLLHYLSAEDGGMADPHPLFDEDYYWAQVPEDERREKPALLHYLAQGAEAASPHPLFDLEFFNAHYHGSSPALAAFLRQFDAPERLRPPLHLIDWREANREFCGLSYLLDHPDLPPDEIPLLHCLRGRTADDPIVIRDNRKSSDVALISRDLPRRTIDAQRLVDCVRERKRRGALADLPGGEDDFYALGDRLAEVEIWSASAGGEGDLAGRIADARKVAIYTLEPGPAGLWRYHRHMAKTLRDAGYTVVLAAASIGDSAPSDCGNDVDLWVSQPSSRNDFRTWAAALTHLAPSLVEAEQLLLLNDNLVGPMSDLQPLLRRLERSPAEIRGLTETICNERRLRADFMLVSGEALTSGALSRMLGAGLSARRPLGAPTIPIDDAWAQDDRVAASVAYADVAEAWTKTMPEQIAWARSLPKRSGAFGLAAHLPPAIVRRYADYLEEWLTDRSDRVAEGEHFDPQHVFWDALIGPQFPFLNKELLLVNPMRVPTLIRLGEVGARLGDEAFCGMLQELVPAASGFPRSYLRLSQALVDAAATVTA